VTITTMAAVVITTCLLAYLIAALLYPERF
jgi:K+-transporting ATPase KdpF subunit